MAGSKSKLKKTRIPSGIGAKNAPGDDSFIGPSPNPSTNLLLADVALRGSAMLVRRGLERGLLGKRYAPNKARQILKGRSLGESLASVAIAKLAVRSVPGALLVGGGLIAKTLYDRRQGRAAERKGEEKIADMAAEGKASES